MKIYYNPKRKALSRELRKKKLESMGLSVLRFYEWDVKKDIHAVVEVIEDWIEKFEKKTQPPESPFSKGDLRNSPLIKGASKNSPLIKGARGLFVLEFTAYQKSRYLWQPNLMFRNFK